MKSKLRKIIYLVLTFLIALQGCTVKIAKSEYVKNVGDGSKKVKPSWEIRETGVSAAAPYVVTAAAATGAYLFTPKPTTPTTGTGSEDEKDPRVTNAVYAGLGGWVVSFFLKKYLVKEQKSKIFTMSEAEDWTKKWDERFVPVGFDPKTDELYVADAVTIKKDALTSIANPIKYTKFNPVIFIDNQIFPALVVSTANSENPSFKKYASPLGIELECEYENRTIKYEIECRGNEYFDKVVGEHTFKYANKKEVITPTIKWDYSKLKGLNESTDVAITFRILNMKSNDAKTGNIDFKEIVVTPRIRSIGDCLFGYLDSNNKVVNLDELFAAYVNEEAPGIQDILKQALKKKYVNAFIGYQGGTKESVDKQVKAVFQEIKDRGIKYSSVTINAGGGQVADQYVRGFDEAMNSDQANCIDGTCLMASILRKIGIKTYLILSSEPGKGHAFLGYYTGDAKRPMEYLETTMIGYSSFEDALLEGNKNIDKTPQRYINEISVDEARLKFKPIGN